MMMTREAANAKAKLSPLILVSKKKRGRGGRERREGEGRERRGGGGRREGQRETYAKHANATAGRCIISYDT
jgi:hypothetical protein